MAKAVKPGRSLGIIADDLTGAMDSSGWLAGQGWRTVVVLEKDYSVQADVLVLNTNSRADDAQTAAQKAVTAAKRLSGRTIFKKIDSTMRGNIGVEIDAILAESGCEKAVITPAFPAFGRTVAHGVLLVNGRPVAETEFGAVVGGESSITALLRKSSRHQATLAALIAVERGPDFLHDLIERTPESLVVCDAATDFHLKAIAQAAALSEGRWLLCGSGGLARQMEPATPAFKAEGQSVEEQRAGPALVLIGSRSETAAGQLRLGKEAAGLPVLDLDFAPFAEEGGLNEEVVWVVAEARRLLRNSKRVALSANRSGYVPALSQYVPGIMAEIAARILEAETIGGVFLSGGDIAEAFCRSAGVSAIEVDGEVEPGVPFGKFIGGTIDGLRIVTKAGGLGTPAAIVKSIPYLEKGGLP